MQKFIFLLKYSLMLCAIFLVACKTKAPLHLQETKTEQRMPPPMVKDTAIISEIKNMEASENKKQNATANATTLGDTLEYFRNDFMRYDNYTYKSNIKTVLLHKAGFVLANPVIELKNAETLLLSFDDLDADIKKYQYTIIHCTADWKPSDLNTNDYISGFTTDYISDVSSSINTLQAYTHYRLEFPGAEVRPKISGNYILAVFVDSLSNLALTRRFMISDSKVDINANVRQATNLDDKNFKQEIVFTLQHNAYNILNPYANLKVVIQKNGRWDNVITALKPSLVRNNEIIYDFEYGNVFQGDNEFRNFDIKSLKYLSENLQNIVKKNNRYYVFLKPAERRSYKRYLFDNDINGKFTIKNEDARNSDTEAEYCFVHFSLPYPAPLVHGQLYILGALTDWSLNENAKMIYNYNTKTYERELYLKQGYYNYNFALVENGTNVADESYIEGTHSQTENDYTLFVYYKEPNENYDRLIGVKFINSLKK